MCCPVFAPSYCLRTEFKKDCLKTEERLLFRIVAVPVMRGAKNKAEFCLNKRGKREREKRSLGEDFLKEFVEIVDRKLESIHQDSERQNN